MSRTGVALISFVFVAVAIVARRASAIDEDFVPSALRAANDHDWSQMTIEVTDQDGRPIEAARVRPWALRAGNGHGVWMAEAYGSPAITRTDTDGKTIVVYPTKSVWTDEPPVVQVSLFVSHAEYCTKNVHVNVPMGDQPTIPTVQLQAGVKLKIAGVDPESGEVLTDCHVMVEGADSDEREFVTQPDGWLQSVPIRKDRRWFRVVRAVPGEPPQFSAPQSWTEEAGKPIEIKAVVRPGVKLTGKVSDDVPRPIANGRVVAWCGSSVKQSGVEENEQERVKPIWWMDTTSINTDGEFEFPSLPSGYLAQLYAIADDHLSVQPSEEAYAKCCEWFRETNQNRHSTFRYGQMLRLVGKSQQFTIPMELTGKIQAKCIDPAGLPVSRITVSSWPNQYIVGAGSTILCTQIKSLDQLRGNSWSRVRGENLFSAVTDEDGIATIRTLPEGKVGVVAANEVWTSKERFGVEITAGKTTEIVVELEPKK